MREFDTNYQQYTIFIPDFNDAVIDTVQISFLIIINQLVSIILIFAFVYRRCIQRPYLLPYFPAPRLKKI